MAAGEEGEEKEVTAADQVREATWEVVRGRGSGMRNNLHGQSQVSDGSLRTGHEMSSKILQ